MNALIKELDDNGHLLRLVKEGFINWNILRDKDIYLTYDVHRKMGKKYIDAIHETSEQFELSYRQIQYIIKKMK